MIREQSMDVGDATPRGVLGRRRKKRCALGALALTLLLVGACKRPQAEESAQSSTKRIATAAVAAPTASAPQLLQASAVPETSCAPRPSPATLAPASPKSSNGGTVALARYDGDTIAFVADADAKQLRAIDIEGEEELAATDLAGIPSQLLIAQDGRIYVTLKNRAEVAVFQAGEAANEPLLHLCSVPVATEPVALAETPNGRGLLVTSRWGRRLALLDTSQPRLDKRFEAKLERDPFAVVVSPDSQYAYVSHVVGGRLSRVTLPQPEQQGAFEPRVTTRKLSAKQRRAIGSSEVLVERVAGQAFAMAMDHEGELFIPSVMVEPGDSSISITSTGYGSGTQRHPVMEDTLFTLFRKNRKKRKNRSDHCVARGEACLLPRAAVFNDTDGTLHVACAGTGQVVSYARNGRNLGAASVGAGVNGLAFDAKTTRWVAWSQFDQQLVSRRANLNTADPNARKLTKIKLKRRGAPNKQIELGRRLFHEAGTGRIAHDGRACASCHPSGREDSLTWATPDGPRQTPMLLSRLSGTAPYGWNGRAQELDKHLRRTLRRLGGSGLTATERKALVAYLHSLEPPQRRAPKNAQLARGEALFNDAVTSCGGCHLGYGTTDGVAHDVGTRITSDAVSKFDTPSLRHISQTAPYFHDGRYPTLLAMVSDHQLKMGSVKQLSDADRQALVVYLETL